MPNHKMCALMGEVSSQVVEREELVEAIAIALLTRKNLFILGDTGQAKSYAINEFRKRITGARQFERLLSKQCDEEALFGRIDLQSLMPGGVTQGVLDSDPTYQTLREQLEQAHAQLLADPDNEERIYSAEGLATKLERYRSILAHLHRGEPTMITTGKIPDSHIVFVDEVFKANDGVLNSLLTALNERRYTNEGKSMEIPVISFLGASNEIPKFTNPEEQILKPLYDRFELKLITHYVESRDKRLAVLRQKQTGTAGQITATVTLDELTAMQAEVATVQVPEAVNELMDDILCELRAKGIHVSDRKYFGYGPIAQAKAWLEGRSIVQPADLTILRHYLWTNPEDKAGIDPVLERMCNDPLKDKLDSILKMAAESFDEFEDSETAADGREIPAGRRIGKLRNEFVQLYIRLTELGATAQNDGERGQIADTLTDLEGYSKKAHDAVTFNYAPLAEIYEIQKMG